MYVIALATDYDETLAEHGRLSETTFEALQQFKETGRRLIMVTGRELPDLKSICPYLHIFDRIVVENGALLYNPATQTERDLAPAPAPILMDRLQQTGIPLSIGRTILATREPHEQTVLKIIHELGLEMEIIFNKGAVMVLPSGVNKGTGLLAACEELDISAHNVIAIGDAENDHSFLQAAGCGVAVANALPALKANAAFVTKAARGAGVAELMVRIAAEDGAVMPPRRDPGAP